MSVYCAVRSREKCFSTSVEHGILFQEKSCGGVRWRKVCQVCGPSKSRELPLLVAMAGMYGEQYSYCSDIRRIGLVESWERVLVETSPSRLRHGGLLVNMDDMIVKYHPVRSLSLSVGMGFLLEISRLTDGSIGISHQRPDFIIVPRLTSKDDDGISKGGEYHSKSVINQL